MQHAAAREQGTVGVGEEVERLGAREWCVRARAADVLRQRGEQALPLLIDGLSHRNWRIRKACADLMDHLADDRCVAPLVRLLQDPIEGVRRLAVHALACQGCKSCPLAVDVVARLVECALTDRSPRVRRVAVHQLGCQPPDTRAAAALRQILAEETDPKLRSRARWALVRQEAVGRRQKAIGRRWTMDDGR
jgi:HEAT repeat protein